jgi:leader peptidase (prepilin peptidase)/N-methyltransferase
MIQLLPTSRLYTKILRDSQYNQRGIRLPPDYFCLQLVIVAIFGLVIGSFLNVVICRYPAGESLARPPSHCPGCQSRLKILDLIPVLSFILLRGRCRYCGAAISGRYAVVEAATASIFVTCFYYFSFPILFLKYAVIFSILLVVSFIDWERQYIPNLFTVILLAWGLLWQLLYPGQTFTRAAAGLLAGGGILLLISLASKGGMGGGDIKLLAVLGFLAGWPDLIIVFLLAVCSGAVAGVILMLLKLKRRKSTLPFGPFIALAFFITSIWGAQIWGWYSSLIRPVF